MAKILTVALIVVGLLLIVTVMMQPSKQNSAASAFTGGADQLFGKQKARGFEAVMRRTTAILGGLWFIIGFALMYLSAH